MESIAEEEEEDLLPENRRYLFHILHYGNNELI
jgi:hypothetical protein